MGCISITLLWLVCNEMVHGLSINDSLLPKSKQKHHCNVNILSVTESEFNTFHFPSGIDVDRSNDYINLSPENAIEVDDDAYIFPV